MEMNRHASESEAKRKRFERETASKPPVWSLLFPFVLGLVLASFIWFTETDPSAEGDYNWQARLGIAICLAALAGFLGGLFQGRRWSLRVAAALLAGELMPPGIVVLWIFLFGVDWS